MNTKAKIDALQKDLLIKNHLMDLKLAAKHDLLMAHEVKDLKTNTYTFKYHAAYKESKIRCYDDPSGEHVYAYSAQDATNTYQAVQLPTDFEDHKDTLASLSQALDGKENHANGTIIFFNITLWIFAFIAIISAFSMLEDAPEFFFAILIGSLPLLAILQGIKKIIQLLDK